MKRHLMALLAASVVTAAALTARTLTQAAPASHEARTPVIVELFTSEGCSSCPPADTLLSQLVKNQPVPGAEVIALGEHVDYWNHGGWADPFSARQFSARQSDYSRAFRLDNVYTPQMVVDGKAQFVGSDDDQAASAIARAARQPKADVSLNWTAGALSVRVDHLPASVKNDPAEVVLAITEDGLSSSVGGGENSGRHLAHSAVVRRLTGLGLVSEGSFTASPAVTLEPAWRRGNLHAVVFVQERANRQIVGAAEIELK